MVQDAFYDLPWPWNDPGSDPGLSRTMASDDTAHTAHAVRLLEVLRQWFSAMCEIMFSVF